MLIAECRGRNGIEQLAPLGALEDRRLAGLDQMLRVAHRRRVGRQHLAGDPSAEQHPHGSELLLDAWRRVLLLQALHVSSSPSRMSFIRGRVRASPSDTRGRSRVPELGSLGSVRGALNNERPYRERVRSARKGRGFCSVW